MHQVTPARPVRPVRRTRDQLVDELFDLLGALARTARVRPSAEFGQVTVHQLEALVSLAEADLTMRELCAELGIAESAGTALADKLVAHGLVARHDDPRDRRVVRLRLTPHARDLVGRYRAQRRAQARTLFDALDDQQLRQLVELYRLVDRGRHPGTPPPPAPSRPAPSPPTSATQETR